MSRQREQSKVDGLASWGVFRSCEKYTWTTAKTSYGATLGDALERKIRNPPPIKGIVSCGTGICISRWQGLPKVSECEDPSFDIKMLGN